MNQCIVYNVDKYVVLQLFLIYLKRKMCTKLFKNGVFTRSLGFQFLNHEAY